MPKKKFHALTAGQKAELRSAGFLVKEIRDFDYSLSLDFNSRPFQSMIKSRRDWRDAMLLNGWTQLEISRRLFHWYRMKKERSPWDFFRLEYATTAQRPKLKQSQFASFLKSRDDVSRGFGRAYGRIRSVKLAQRRGLPGVPRKR